MPQWSRLISNEATDADIDELTRKLGPRLAPWLTDAAWRRIGMEPPRPMLLRTGEFGILLCAAYSAAHIHAGLVLPCRWISPGDAGSTAGVHRVPCRLGELADGAAVRLSASRCIGGAKPAELDFVNGARLSVGDGIGDLSEFELSPESAGAALAATLALAALGVSPRQHCAVSATVDPTTGLGSVTGLTAKVDAARRAGIQQVFVAGSQGECPEGCTRIDGPNASAQLGSLMLRLDAPPMAGTDADKWAWYKRVSGFPDSESKLAAQRFYASELAVKAAEHARSAAQSAEGVRAGLPAVHELIVIATGSVEVSLASIALHRPQRLVILSINDANDTSKRFVQHLLDRRHDLPNGIISGEPVVMRLQEWLCTGSSGTQVPCRILDISGGPTAHKVQALDHARSLGMFVSCLDISSGVDKPRFIRL
jgi:hypothetical protein